MATHSRTRETFLLLALAITPLAASCSAGRTAASSGPTSAPPAAPLPAPERIIDAIDPPRREVPRDFTRVIDGSCDAMAWHPDERKASASLHLGAAPLSELRRARRGRLVVVSRYRDDSSAVTRGGWATVRHERDRPAQARELRMSPRDSTWRFALDLAGGTHEVEVFCTDCWRLAQTFAVRVGFVDTLVTYHGRARPACGVQH